MNPEWASVAIQIFLAFASASGIAISFYVNSTVQKKLSAIEDGAAQALGLAVDKSATSLEGAISKLYAIINGYGDRIARLETTVDGLPHGNDVHEIALQCSELVGEIKQLRAEMGAIGDSSHANQRSLQRLEDFVINSKMDARQ